MKRRSVAALVYDFDGTLCPGSMQQHTLLPEMGYSNPSEFWRQVKDINREVNGDEILTYMQHLVSDFGEALTKERFREHGKQLPFFDGVEQWFPRINAFATERGLTLEHYIVSSGLEELIEGCSIRKHFRHVFASKYAYRDGKACWPAIAINYTGKTQYLFRINKGVLNSWDDTAVNRWIPMEERPLPFQRMIFIGDGDTDIPAMKMLRHQGGASIAVFDPAQFSGPDSQKVYNLIAEDRATYVCPADYSQGSQLDVVVKGILGRFARDAGYRPR